MQNNQNRRSVLVDEDFLRQLLSQVQSRRQQTLVPNQGTIPTEYRIFDDSLPARPNPGNDEVEMDLNQSRNQVIDETFHSGIIL